MGERRKGGRLHPHHTSSNGYRYYSEEQLSSVTGIIEKPRRVFGYCRVSSPKQKYDLERQVENIKTYQKSEQQELIEDLVQIITVFSCKLQGKRANKAKKKDDSRVGGRKE